MAPETALSSRSTPGLRALERWLRDQAISHQVVRHEPTFEATHEARAARIPAEQTAKTLVLRDDDEAEIAACFPGFEIGAIPPLGPAAVDEHVVDRRLLTYNRVLCSAGHHGHSVVLDTMELVRDACAVIADVCKDHPRR
jgi:prolyl-tRNA editing enzyme YbaK/EbsC (Cys-tRNA(Pro) deacylase)